jgi:hypothetical protein
MELVNKGTYTYGSLHPPVAKIAVALLPYLDGARSHGDRFVWDEGNDILYSQGHYWRTLTLSRLGILPFYILCLVLLWWWTKQLFGELTASFAVILLSLIPPVLAHAGLSTTDMPLTTMLLASCCAWWFFLQAPNWKRSLLLGTVVALSAATKFSFLVFFPIAALIILGHGRSSDEERSVRSLNWHRVALLFVIAGAGVCLTIWACYNFSYGPVLTGTYLLKTENLMRSKISTGWLVSIFIRMIHVHLPAPEFFNGIGSLFWQGHKGHATYLLGHVLHDRGSPLFFPVALAVKTPIAFLVLLLGAVMLAIRRKNFWRDPMRIPLLISAGILAVCIPSSINLGVRHILPIYPFLAVLAAIAAVWLYEYKRPFGWMILTALVGWMLVSSVHSDPDRLAYFNEFAGSHPEYFLVDSDLDWGQDIDKLGDTLRARRIEQLEIRYEGCADMRRRGFPLFDTLRPYAHPTTRWVAISMFDLYAEQGYERFRDVKPTVKVGNSIRLYDLADSSRTGWTMN